MLTLIQYLISLFLIIIIFVRIPEDNAGLTSFTTTSTIFGSPKSAQRILNSLTGISILAYLLLAVLLNFSV